MTCKDVNVDEIECSDIGFSPSSSTKVDNGTGTFQISAPGEDNTGTLNCTLTLDPWLGNDTAPATFGIYKGNEHIIYQQETTWK